MNKEMSNLNIYRRGHVTFFFLSNWLGPKWLMKSISHPSSEGMRGLYHLGPTISIFSFRKWGQKINDLELKPIFINYFCPFLTIGCMLPFVGEQMQSAKKKRGSIKHQRPN